MKTKLTGLSIHLCQTCRMTFVLAALTLLALGSGSFVSAKPVSVIITKVACASGCRNEGLEGPGESAPDFYAKVFINGVEQITPRWPEDQDSVTQNMIVTQEVPDTIIDVPITIQIWDDDDFFGGGDDLGDADPNPGDGNLDLVFHRNTGTWTGDVNSPVNCATGNGEPGGGIFGDDPKPPVTVCFEIGTDTDGDGLLDSWENGSYDANGDGVPDVNLQSIGANPQRKDLLLEIDYLLAVDHSHAPFQAAIQQVVQSFANAPVPNVDGTTGIQLHVDTGPLYGAGTVFQVVGTGGVTGSYGDFGGGGNQIPEAGNTIVDWDGANGNPGTSFYTLKAANFNAFRAQVFRYCLFVHQVNSRAAVNDCTSGWAEGIPGNDFMVSLGGVGRSPLGPCWGQDANGFSVGNQNQQAGTLMHEFGHTLGLRHGGSDDTNRKPNHLSVMNYAFQSSQVPVVAPTTPPCPGFPGGLPGGADYSRLKLPDLNEGSLDECQGSDGGLLCLGPVNWNGNTTPAGPILEGISCPAPNNANIANVNINNDTSNDLNNNNRQDPGEPPIFGTLTGFEEWNNLRYDFRTQQNFANGVASPVPDEPDPDTIEQSRAYLASLLQPVLTLDKTGPSDAIPGDRLNYSIKIKNTGRGPALNVVLTDDKPDLTQDVSDFGIVVLAQEVERSVTFLVPCSTPDKTVLANLATVVGEDMLANPMSGSDSVLTTVHAPVLALSKTATATVNAGEAITYTITYENTGSGAAANVVITEIIPAGVYYSKALDLGTGPKPDSVTLNSDGTRTLTWNIGAVAGNSGSATIVITARPTLLALGGTSYANSVSLSFQNANGCVYDAVSSSASTSIAVVPATRYPLSQGFWRNHPELWLAEVLARIQATDQRYDGRDGGASDGALSAAEVSAMFLPGGNMSKVLEQQLLATYFNLATRRINAGTVINSRLVALLGVGNVRGAALYAIATLSLPVNSANRARYSNITSVMDDINANKIER